MHQMDLVQWGRPHSAAVGAFPHAQRLPHKAALYRRIAAEELEPPGAGQDADRVGASHLRGSRVTATALHHPAGPFTVRAVPVSPHGPLACSCGVLEMMWPACTMCHQPAIVTHLSLEALQLLLQGPDLPVELLY